MKRLGIIALCVLLLIGCFYLAFADQITLSTYYPAPYGVYKDLRILTGDGGQVHFYYDPDTPDKARIRPSDDKGIIFSNDGDLPILTIDEASLNVGIGTTNPDHKLQIGDSNTAVSFSIRGPDANIESGVLAFEDDAGTGSRWFKFIHDTNSNLLKVTSADVNPIMVIQRWTGNVGIGTGSPTAKLHIAGNIKAELNNLGALPAVRYDAISDEIGFDVAEIFATNEEVEVGDLVVVDENGKKLRKSQKPYEGGIVGVVSSSPAILFEGSQLQIAPQPGGFKEGKNPPVALMGRIPVKICLENGPIKPGDLLTSSSIPGHAMKATEAGPVLGKALESFDGSKTNKGKVLAFINVAWYGGDSESKIARLEARIEELEKIINKRLVVRAER